MSSSLVNGFATRKSKVVRNSKGEKLQQTFVCFKEGFKEEHDLTFENRKRDAKRWETIKIARFGH
ncbi:hypothetical protein CR513_43633, partial [Mucuna pruriens]